MLENTDEDEEPSSKVSIVVPVYNGIKYLDGCISSILLQSYKNIELIIVDDGSTDGSGNACDAYAVSDARVVVVHSENKGPSNARNIGIEISSGEFMFFADCDDWLDVDAVKVLVNAFKVHRVDVVVGNFVYLDGRTGYTRRCRPTEENRLFSKDEITNEIMHYMCRPGSYPMFMVVWGKLYKTSIIKNNQLLFDTNVHMYEDIKFVCGYYKLIKSMFYCSETVYTYRSFHSALSAGSLGVVGNPTCFKQAVNYFADYLNSSNVDPDLIQRAVKHSLVSFAIRGMISIIFANGLGSVFKNRRLISRIIEDSDVRMALIHYTPISKSESRVLPVLIKFRLILLALIVCMIKVRQIANRQKMTRPKVA